MEKQQNNKNQLKKEIRGFVLHWHDFPIDYWWRKRYNVPFGSEAHRSMNFIDMAIEFEECEIINSHLIKINKEKIEREYDEQGGVYVSDDELEQDYESLNLEQFDKK